MFKSDSKINVVFISHQEKKFNSANFKLLIIKVMAN